MSLQLSVFILCLSFLLVAIAAVPFLLQLWRTMKTLEMTLQTLNRTLPGLLENLEAITLDLRHVTLTVDVQVERLALAVDRASFGLGVLWNLRSVLLTGARMPLIRRIRTFRAFGRGVRTFFNVLQVYRPVPERKPAELPEGDAGPRSSRGNTGEERNR